MKPRFCGWPAECQIRFRGTQPCAPRVSAELLSEGVTLHKLGKLDEAAEFYHRSLRDNPRDAEAFHLLGVIAHQRGDQATAIRRIRQAVAIDGPKAVYLSNLGVAYRTSGRTAEAIETLEQAVELDPAPAGTRYNLANALKDASRYSEAAAAYRASLDRDGQNPEAWTGLGDALRWLKEFDESVLCHNRAIELRQSWQAPITISPKRSKTKATWLKPHDDSCRPLACNRRWLTLTSTWGTFTRIWDSFRERLPPMIGRYACNLNWHWPNSIARWPFSDRENSRPAGTTMNRGGGIMPSPEFSPSGNGMGQQFPPARSWFIANRVSAMR